MSRFRALCLRVAAALLRVLASRLFGNSLDSTRESDWPRADGRRPLIKINRHAFPEGACAEYDRLAAENGLRGWISQALASGRVAPVNIPLGWRRATQGAIGRVEEAYQP